MDATLIDQLKALGEPNRLAIMGLLRRGPVSANDLLDRLPMSQPSLSRHVKILREAGLIAESRQGRLHVYSLIRSTLSTLVLAQAGHDRPGTPAGSPPRPREPIQNINQTTYQEPEPSRDDFQEWLR
jgi:DNA-binding transcriptional ArsR family regulator